MTRSNVATLTRRSILFAPLALVLPGQAGESVYACPMDPDVTSDRPGTCSKCGMALRLRAADAGTAPRISSPPMREGRISGLHIPDTKVLDQNGRELRFYSDLVKGKTVAVNFIFTTCTTICPPLTATFRSVQKSLGARVGKDIALISISVDPAVDIPERLKSFSEKFRAEPGWTFVTGTQSDIDRLLEALGAAVANKTDHTPMILIGNDRSRYWTRAYGLAPASKLVKVITDAADRTGIQ